jgi:hypothetical protein
VVGYSDNDIAILRNNVLIALTKVCRLMLHLSASFAESDSIHLWGRATLTCSEEKEDLELGKSRTLPTPPTPKLSSKSLHIGPLFPARSSHT